MDAYRQKPAEEELPYYDYAEKAKREKRRAKVLLALLGALFALDALSFNAAPIAILVAYAVVAIAGEIVEFEGPRAKQPIHIPREFRDVDARVSDRTPRRG